MVYERGWILIIWGVYILWFMEIIDVGYFWVNLNKWGIRWVVMDDLIFFKL